jgi:16S rRNA (adenine1518-N6/adenine1519-N6)-dimethyltransferase
VTQRPPWQSFRAALEQRGFLPSRRLGQNFLLDENMVRAIVRDAQVGPGDVVLEIGAGCGFLSLHLVEAGVDLLCVEVDERLLPIAEKLVSGRGRARFLLADVLAGKNALAPEVARALPGSGYWHLVSNLPYSIAGPLLALLAARPNPPATMTVLVQREVAERIAAEPGTREWGPLSIRLQARYASSILRKVPPDLFWPRPRVESAVARLVRRTPAWEAEELESLDRLAGELLGTRRQSLGRVLGRSLGDREAARAAIERTGIEPSVRAETLGLEAWRRLIAVLRAGENLEKPWEEDPGRVR